MHGGGTYTQNATPPTLQAYENIFGPSARDIKHDLQEYKRHGRWHLPDILKGPNQYLTDRVDGLITDAKSSPFTSRILPYKYITNVDGKIKWNVWSFDEGLASRVPYESAARTLTQSKRGFAGYAVRQGMAIVLEHNFMMSEAGRINFKNQLNQLIGSIQMTNDLDVHMALLLAPSYAKHMREKYILDAQTPSQTCRQFVDLFGFMQKNVNALDILIEEAKAQLRSWGADMPDFMLANSKLTFGLQMTPERTSYLTQGPEGPKRLKTGPLIESYRGIDIIPTRAFSMETATPPRDVLRRRVRVAEYYRIPPSENNINRTFELYNEDRDTWFAMTFAELLKHAKLPGGGGYGGGGGGGGSDQGMLDRIQDLKPADMKSYKQRPDHPLLDSNSNDRLTQFSTEAKPLPTSGDVREPRFRTQAGHAVPETETNRYWYAPGYINPSRVQHNLHPTVPKGYKHYADRGIVDIRQHKLKEFRRLMKNNSIRKSEWPTQLKVFLQFGVYRSYNKLWRNGATLEEALRSSANVGDPSPKGNVATIGIADDYLYRTELPAAAILCPNYRVKRSHNPKTMAELIGKFAIATDTMHQTLLDGNTINQTTLYRLVTSEEGDGEYGTSIAEGFIAELEKHKESNKSISPRALGGLCALVLSTKTRRHHHDASLSDLVFQEPEDGDHSEDDTEILIPNTTGNPALILAWFAFRYFANWLDPVNTNVYNGVINLDSPTDRGPSGAYPPDDWKGKDWEGEEASGDDDPTDVVKAAANVEIVIVRPNIEHYMMGIILGKGGEGLGSTFWGQTELSCYDDAQHGIWGMSYKYHERAIVINERNLVRLWDIAYDGYVGGKDDRAVKWESENPDDADSVHSFGEATREITKNYHGPSMMVMAFLHTDPQSCKTNWPSPILFHDQRHLRTGPNSSRHFTTDPGTQFDANAGTYMDPENGKIVQTKDFQVFDQNILGYAQRYPSYYQLMPDFARLAVDRKTAGVASAENEVCSDMLAFQGSMRVKDLTSGGLLNEVHGSGHHGNDFVGVASLRAGKGYRIQSQPTPGRLV